MQEISKKIIDKIKNEDLKPTPKWHFLLRDYIIWSFFIISILLGSISFSVIIFFLSQGDWDVYKFLNKGLLEYVILSFPYFWMIFIFFFLGVAYYNCKHTKAGYKYNHYLIIIFSIIISFLLGFTMFIFGFGEKVDSILIGRFPRYEQNLMNRQKAIWNHPEEGLLIGNIIGFQGRNFNLKDFDKRVWQVRGNDATWIGGIPKKDEEILVKIIGKKEGAFIFRAKIIKRIKGGCYLMNNKLKEKKLFPRINRYNKSAQN